MCSYLGTLNREGGHVIPNFKGLSAWELRGEEDFDLKGLKEF